MNTLDKITSYLNEETNVDHGEFWSDWVEMVMEFFDTIDMDQLNEDQEDLLDNILDMIDEDMIEEGEVLDEIKKKLVVRGGKKVKKLICPEGKKVVSGKCVRVSSAEKRVRSKAAKKSARKRKGKSSQIARKRAKSMKKRGSMT